MCIQVLISIELHVHVHVYILCIHHTYIHTCTYIHIHNFMYRWSPIDYKRISPNSRHHGRSSAKSATDTRTVAEKYQLPKLSEKRTEVETKKNEVKLVKKLDETRKGDKVHRIKKEDESEKHFEEKGIFL